MRQIAHRTDEPDPSSAFAGSLVQCFRKWFANCFRVAGHSVRQQLLICGWPIGDMELLGRLLDN